MDKSIGLGWNEEVSRSSNLCVFVYDPIQGTGYVFDVD